MRMAARYTLAAWKFPLKRWDRGGRGVEDAAGGRKWRLPLGERRRESEEASSLTGHREWRRHCCWSGSPALGSSRSRPSLGIGQNDLQLRPSRGKRHKWKAPVNASCVELSYVFHWRPFHHNETCPLNQPAWHAHSFTAPCLPHVPPLLTQLVSVILLWSVFVYILHSVPLSPFVLVSYAAVTNGYGLSGSKQQLFEITVSKGQESNDTLAKSLFLGLRMLATSLAGLCSHLRHGVLSQTQSCKTHRSLLLRSQILGSKLRESLTSLWKLT